MYDKILSARSLCNCKSSSSNSNNRLNAKTKASEYKDRIIHLKFQNIAHPKEKILFV